MGSHLESIWRLMAIEQRFQQLIVSSFGQMQLGLRSMDRFLQHYRGYGYGLVEQLGHRLLGQ
jgi:hypothetical protein